MPTRSIRVEVVRAEPGRARIASLELPAGARVAQALAACGLAHAAAFGIHGKRVSGDAPLRDGDRVEIYRPLACDPMEARRRRARKAAARRP